MNDALARARTAASSAGPFALFLFVLAAALVTRTWRLVDLVGGEAPVTTLLWLPLLVGRDLLLALAFAIVAAGLLAVRLPPVLVLLVTGVASTAAVLWRAANVLCYRVLQGPITLPRLTGNEGARAKDIDLLEWRDIWPILALAVALLLVLPFAVRLARRMRERSRLRALAIATLLGAVLTLVDSFALRRFNFGLSDEPVAIFLESCALEWDAWGGSALPPPGDDAERELAGLFDLETARTPALGADPNGVRVEGSGKVKNVVLFFAEGIPREYTGLFSEGVTSTPNLQRRARAAGLELDRYYSPFHKSILAIFAAVCSEWPPPNGMNITLMNPRIDCGELSEVTSSWGVHAGLFHAAEFSFYDKLALLGARGYEVQRDAVSLKRAEPDLESNTWGVDDRAMVRSTLAWIDSLPPDDRFVANLITLSPHYPYLLPSDVPIEAKDGSEGNRYESALQFLDVVFEELMVGLEERGLADDTAVIFVADHGESFREPMRPSPGRRLAYDNNLHVPFVIFAPKLFPTKQMSARLGSHVDLVPTILDLMGLPQVPQHRGQSLVSPRWQEKRVFFAALNGLDHYVGFMDGWNKIIVHQTSGRAERYDLRADPEEMNDLFDEDSEADRGLVADALLFYALQTARLEAAPEVERLDVERIVADAVDVHVRRGEQRIACPMGMCPGDVDPVVVGARDLRVAGGRRSCLAVRVPPSEGDVLELDVTDPAVLAQVSYVRYGLGPVGVRPAGEIEVQVTSDDAEPISRKLTRTVPSKVMRFETPTQRMHIELKGEPFDGLVCLAFSSADWH